jgi:hypothetical protein
MYTVHQSKFHGGHALSTHRTLDAALRAAAKHAGGCWSRANGFRARTPASCCCGGPTIESGDPAELVTITRDDSGERVVYVERIR